MFHHGSGGVSHRLLLNRGWAVHPIRPLLFTRPRHVHAASDPLGVGPSLALHHRGDLLIHRDQTGFQVAFLDFYCKWLPSVIQLWHGVTT